MSKHARRSHAASLARMIADASAGGAELVTTAFDIMRDPAHPDRFKALQFLADRMAGRAPVVVEAESSVSIVAGRAPAELSDEELERVVGLLRGTLGEGVQDEEDAEVVQ